jgi:SAM-dependent methyltransferase
MGAVDSPQRRRKRLGQWATPPALVDAVVRHTITGPYPGGARVRVLDPACGDGRFVFAAAARVAELGAEPVLTGVDVDPGALAAAAATPMRWSTRWILADTLAHDWRGERFDVVIGNPPFVSQLAAATTRGGASRFGGGAYADVAAEFLALAVELAEPDGGRVGLVLPQSILGSRDAGPLREQVDDVAALRWCWWSAVPVFDAAALTCALAFELGGDRLAPVERSEGPAFAPRPAVGRPDSWSGLVAVAAGVPELAALATSGSLGERAEVAADFRDQYYGLIDAVGDHVTGPPLVTSGVIDVARCTWGERPVRFAKRRFASPRVALDRLDGGMRRWAATRLVPKVLVANQTRVIEAVADVDGAWLPGVPVLSVMPRRAELAAVAALLTSPIASAWAWHHAAGTGRSAGAVRLRPALLASIPWPARSLDAAIAALAAGDVVGCGRAVTAAYGLAGDDAEALLDWWAQSVRRRAQAPATSPEPGLR